MSLRVLVNTLGVSDANEGIRTLLVSLLRALVRVDTKNHYLLVCSRTNAELFDDLGDRVDRLMIRHSGRRLIGRIWSEQVTVPIATRHSADVYLTPGTVGPLRPTLPTVVVVAAHLAIPSMRSVPGGSMSPAHRIYYGPLMRWSHRRATYVVPISDYVGRALVRETGLDEGRVVPIPCGVDPPHVPFDASDEAGRDVVLFLGTLYPYKNVTALIDAVAIARSRLPDGIRLVVVGRDPDGAQRARLQESAARAGIADVVDFTGSVSDEHLEQLWSQSLVFVLPSHSEGFGLPILEAMARGVPVIASNSTALPEVVGDAGLLFDPDRPDELADRICAVANDRALRDELRQAGRLRAAARSWDRTAESYVEILERTARRRR